jgi:hypothetical protein
MEKIPKWSERHVYDKTTRYEIDFGWLHVTIHQYNSTQDRKWYLTASRVSYIDHRLTSVHADMAKVEALKLVIERLQDVLEETLITLNGV